MSYERSVGNLSEKILYCQRTTSTSHSANEHKPASQHPIVLGGFYPLLDRIGVEEAVSRVSNSPHHLLHRILTDLDIALGHLKRTVTSQSLNVSEATANGAYLPSPFGNSGAAT